MCNLWTGEHVFIWTSGSATDARIPGYLVCRCGAFRYDGKPVNITYDKSIECELRKELKVIKPAYIVGNK